MADQFETYTKLLAVLKPGMTVAAQRKAMQDGNFSFNDGEPISGYFRCAAVKKGPLLPVAIWTEAGKLNVLRNNEPVALERVWPWCVTSPIPYDWYEAKTERGAPWPDEHAEQAEAAAEADMPEREQIGGNKPPADDAALTLTNEIEKARKGLKKYSEIASDEQAAQAQDLRSKLNELAGTADKKREAEKRPHLDLCKEIDGKWQPLVKLAKAGADAIRDALRAWETKKFRAEQEAQRQRDAEAAAAQAAGEPAPEPPAEDEAPPPQATVIKGATGRAATIRTIKVAKVVDQDAAYKHLRAVPEIRDAIAKVAQRLVNAGNSVPGVEISEERDVA